MEDTNSWNEMIFRQIRARKDWVLALIWRNRLEHESDIAHIEVEDLEVKKKIYLDKWEETQENPLFTEWCRGRMNKDPSGEVRSDELLQEKKVSSREEKVDVPLPGKRISLRREESRTILKTGSSNLSAQVEHDEKFQVGRKIYRKPTNSPYRVERKSEAKISKLC